jgi:steroid 5-alpha reductase family enzyme
LNFFEIYSLCGLIILAMMSLLWIFSLALKDASIVDIFWGMGFLISAWFYYLITPDGFPIRKLLVCLLVSTWALRLSIYIFWHNREKGEDYRYQIWRAESGPQWWWRSYFKVFLLQGILMWIISAPLLGAQLNSKPNYLTWLDYLGCLVWVIGFLFETAGDGQLASFKAVSANKGKVLSSGVWRYSRHPNYYGDCAQW